MALNPIIDHQPEQLPQHLARPALSVPGLTMSRALMYLPGHDQIFERVLRRFAGQYPHGIAGLPAALAAGDWPQAQRLLHAFRGACGAIGATDLLAQSAALEALLDQQGQGGPGNRCHDPEALAACGAQIDADLIALVGVILAQMDRAPEAIDRPALHAAMDALAWQLREEGLAAGAAFLALAPQLHMAWGAASVQPVADALARQDPAAALLALQTLRQTKLGS